MIRWVTQFPELFQGAHVSIQIEKKNTCNYDNEGKWRVLL